MCKPTMLIVDEEEGLTDLFSEFLMVNFNVNVIVQNHSNDVMYLLNNYPVDIIIQDIHVPGPDGFEVAKQIKKTGNNVIIFLMTDWKEESYYFKSADVGANFMPKPIGFKILQNRLTEIFEQNRLDYKKK